MLRSALAHVRVPRRVVARLRAEGFQSCAHLRGLSCRVPQSSKSTRAAFQVQQMSWRGRGRAMRVLGLLVALRGVLSPTSRAPSWSISEPWGHEHSRSVHAGSRSGRLLGGIRPDTGREFEPAEHQDHTKEGGREELEECADGGGEEQAGRQDEGNEDDQRASRPRPEPDVSSYAAGTMAHRHPADGRAEEVHDAVVAVKRSL